MKIIQTDGKNPDFLTLTHELDIALNAAIGGFEKRTKFVQFNQPETMDCVILLYDQNEICIGCGAYRRYDNQTAEVKRIFVREENRGNHYSDIILKELISIAKDNHFTRLILETGYFLTASVHVYKKMGFYIIPNYPPYESMTESICMEMDISNEMQITYKTTKNFQTHDLVELFHSVDWISANYPTKLEKAINNSATVISAWDGNKLIGLMNALDDSSLTAYVHYLLVHPNYQKSGIGRTLVNHMKDHYKDYLYLLIMAETKNVVKFYTKQEFTINTATPLIIMRT